MQLATRYKVLKICQKVAEKRLEKMKFFKKVLMLINKNISM